MCLSKVFLELMRLSFAQSLLAKLNGPRICPVMDAYVLRLRCSWAFWFAFWIVFWFGYSMIQSNKNEIKLTNE
jgi:hypothetical protein